ncbi:zinc ribbon domain-containing protein [Nocardia sp. NPDC057668]|uniref:zinc ribbon domain-containing protein n=1 Tax=Nocardia sp. NPDC057668 TaxID=3346202 RepID=UPI00367203B3
MNYPEATDTDGPASARQFSFTTRPVTAVDDATGESIGLDEIESRIGWLLALVTVAGSDLLARLWQPATFDILATGRDRQGRKLPAHGHVAAARLGWTPVYPDGVYVPSRVTRVVATQTVATLRTMAYRDAMVSAHSARFDPEPRCSALTAGSDTAMRPGFARGALRQIVAHAEAGHRAFSRPLRITDMQSAPGMAAMAQLSAADRQFAHLVVVDGTLQLTVQLPLCWAPTGRTQWRRVRLTAVLPAHLRGRVVRDWHLPTLIVDRRGVLWRCAATEMVPAREPTTATTAVGVDWSPSTLGAAAVVRRDRDGLFSDFRGWTYDDRGLGVKLARLQTEGQRLQRKSVRLSQLARRADPEVAAILEAKIAVLTEQRIAVGAKRRRINRELAFHFARQITDYSVTAGARLIGVEDLATFEPRGRGRRNNDRAAQSARGQAVAALAHTAAGAGITVVSVPASGTSALCPNCDELLSRPDGYHSAWCERCRLGGNRDHMAGVNVAKRALSAKPLATRRGGRVVISASRVSVPVRRCRAKNGPTPPRPRHRRVRRSSSSPVTPEGVNLRRNFPAPQASVWDMVEPAVPQCAVGSRDTRNSRPTAASPAVGMRAM